MRATFNVILFCAASVAAASDGDGRVVIATCPGRGYVPYGYPAFGSCPCGEDGCFSPGRYYACDDAYQKSFWRRWRRAHFCGGSMLDGVPCRCLVPPGRLVSVPLMNMEEPELAAPPTEPVTLAPVPASDLVEPSFPETFPTEPTAAAADELGNRDFHGEIERSIPRESGRGQVPGRAALTVSEKPLNVPAQE